MGPFRARPVVPAVRISVLSARRSAVVSVWLGVASLVVFLPGGMTPWFLPKAAVLALAVTLAAVASAHGALPRRFWYLVGTLGVVLVVAAAVSDAPLPQLVGRWPRYEGLVMIPVYVAAAWWGARLLGPKTTPGILSTARAAFSVASIAIGVLAVVESFGLAPIPTDVSRPGSLLGNATDQGIVSAALLCLVLPAMLRAVAEVGAMRSGNGAAAGRGAAAVTPGHVLLLVAGVTAAGVSVALSGSRAAIAACLGGLVLVALLSVVGRDRKPAPVLRSQRVVGLGSAVAVLLLALLVPATRGRVFGTSPLASSTIDDRLLMWRENARLLQDHLVVGVGPSGFMDEIAGRHGAQWFADVGPDVVLDSPHSWVLQAVNAGGVPLLLLALALMAYVAVVGWRRVMTTAVSDDVPAGRTPRTSPTVLAVDAQRRDLTEGALVALAVLAAALLTHFTTTAVGILAGMLVGLVVAVAPGASPAPAVRRVRVAVLGVWSVVLLVSAAAEVPLVRGVNEAGDGSVSASAQAFSIAAAMRPWDADVELIAAQSLTARADGGDTDAAQDALDWSTRAADAVPSSVPAVLSLGVAQRAAGNAAASVATLAPLAERVEGSATIALQHGVSLAVAGDLGASVDELSRALELDPASDEIAAALTQVIRFRVQAGG